MTIKGIKYLDIHEFKDFGFLQEVNRKFFHPLGLALEVSTSAEGVATLGGIWDYRDDPEGMLFGEGMIDENKVKRVHDLLKSKIATRTDILGYHIQGDTYGSI